MTHLAGSRRVLLWTLVVGMLLVWFANLDARSLIRPDEGRYAEIAREMAASGDWVTPRLNGLKYFEKPPLQYWLTAAAYSLFRPDEWTARWWPAVSGVLTAWLLWIAGRRTFGRRAAALAAFVFATMLWPVANSHLNTLDMGLTFFLTLALAGLLQAEQAGREDPRHLRWMALAWLGCAGAVLSKGLIGLVLPGGAVVLYLAATRDWHLLARLRIGTGLAIVLAVCAPWFVAVSVRNPEFLHFFFVHEHFERYLTTVHHRTEPWWYFLPLLLAGTLPWTLLAAQSVAGAVRAGPPGRPFRPGLFLLAWIVFVTVFFSASSSKLPSYVLPVFPALAWLMGDRLDRIRGRALVWYGVSMLPLAVGAFALGLRATHYANDRTPVVLYRAFEPWILGAAVTMAVAATACIVLAARRHLIPAILALGLGGLGAWQLAITGHDALAPSFSSAAFARAVKDRLDPDCPLYSVRTYDQTLPFYLGRTVTLVAFEDEMAFGLGREPDLGIPDIGTFATRWRAATCAYAFMEPGTYDELVAAGLPMTVMERDTRRVLVSRAPTSGPARP
ncbi:MAG: phospholipid carrier-dependent glycosyltransferase [Betaproteobacteria bacterium]|nr:phospholipid carrier-dependent glycosyltransferase [Betaproteobacteria bacterium]